MKQPHDPQTTKVTISNQGSFIPEKQDKFDELAEMCTFAVERGDIDLLEGMISDEPWAMKEFEKWKKNQ